MINENEKKELNNLKANLLTYLREQDYYQPNRKGFFLCQDPEHQDTNPSMMYNKKNNTCHCFSCGATHDLFWFIQRDYKLRSFPEAIAKAKELFAGIKNVVNSHYTPFEKDFSGYFDTIKENIPFEYLNSRGINEWLASAMGVFFDKQHNSIIIPTSSTSYTERFIEVINDTEDKTRYKHYGSSKLFQPLVQRKYKFPHIPPTFIVEGELDAMSIFAGSGLGDGAKKEDKLSLADIKTLAIGLGSANNWHLYINELKKYSTEDLQKTNIVLALDNDRAGQSGRDKLIEELDKINARYIVVNPYGPYKDANDALVNEPEKFKENILQIAEHWEDIYKNEFYFNSAFENKNTKVQSGATKHFKIEFIAEEFKDAFKQYILNNTISNIYIQNDEFYMEYFSEKVPLSFQLGLLEEDVFPTKEEYAAFNNLIFSKEKYEGSINDSISGYKEIKSPPSSDQIIHKLKFLITDLYRTYYNQNISDAYIQNDDIYLYLRKLDENEAKLELTSEEKTVYTKLVSTMKNLNLKFESFYTNYKRLTTTLLTKIKEEDIKIQLDKDKLCELRILDENYKILKYPEFYKCLSEALKNPISSFNDTNPPEKKVNIESAASNKYVNTKAYETNTPYVLRKLPIFCCWKNVWDEKRNAYVKMPINPKNGKRAMPNEEDRCFPPVYDENRQIVFDKYIDSTGKERKKIRRNFDGSFDLRRLNDDMCSWTDFETACNAVDKWGCDGIGVNAIKHLNLFILDLDRVKDSEGNLSSIATEFISTLQTYTEYSPSGTGIHMLGYADIDENRAIRRDNIELYSAKHFITLTGNLVENIPVKVCSKKSATPAINALIKKYLYSTTNKNEHFINSSENKEDSVNQLGFDNDTIRKKCSAMFEIKKNQYSNLNLFDELYYNGNWSAFFSSQSEADLFLVGRLKFFTTSKTQVDTLFRESALMRPKWDQNVSSGMTYGMKTINYCFEKQKYSYTNTLQGEK